MAWQIDPFGHAASTPAVLAHLGYKHVVVNRVPRGARRRRRRRGREFVWTRAGSSRGQVVAHLLRRHYNVPRALDFTGERTDVDWASAAVALEAEAVASVEGLARGAGRAMMLVGDDFRFKDAERTFAAWETLLARVGSGDRGGDRDGGGGRAGPKGPGKRSAFRFAWSTPAEYFAATASNPVELPRRVGSFLPYADNWPVSENAWVGSFVHRRELKRAVVASSTAALNAGSLAALCPNGAKDVERIETSRAERAAYLGLHHDAITGTCPKSVADDFTAWARKGEALARDATARSAARALRCDVGAEHSWTEEHGWTGSDGGAARLREPGDAVAVHNPTGWVLPYAEVRLLVGRRVKIVDARTGRAVPTQERRTDGVRFLNGLLRSPSLADGEEDDDTDGLSETVVALTDLPPLGIVRLAAVAVGDDEMKTTGDVGGYAKAPRRDPAVTFESDGTAAVGGVKMSVASVASPADERFGDGPYVSRSGLWHVLPVVCGALVCFVNVTFAAWVAARALGKRRAAPRRQRRRGLLDGASPVKSSKPRRSRVRDIGVYGFLATFAARARRFNRYSLAERSTRSKPLATRVARRFAAPACVGVVLVLAAHSTAFVSDASHGSIVRGGYRSGAWIGGVAGLVNAARSRGKGTMGGAAASGCVAALAAFVTLARAPSLSYRGMVGHGLIAPRCFAGEVYTEYIARFGAVANPSLPSAVLTVRERAGRALETERVPPREPPPIEVEWAALAPEDVEAASPASFHRTAPPPGACSWTTASA